MLYSSTYWRDTAFLISYKEMERLEFSFWNQPKVFVSW